MCVYVKVLVYQCVSRRLCVQNGVSISTFLNFFSNVIMCERVKYLRKCMYVSSLCEYVLGCMYI